MGARARHPAGTRAPPRRNKKVRRGGRREKKVVLRKRIRKISTRKRSRSLKVAESVFEDVASLVQGDMLRATCQRKTTTRLLGGGKGSRKHFGGAGVR